MMMLVGPGRQERTEPEYRTLLGKAGFRLTRLVPTESAVSVVEAVLTWTHIGRERRVRRQTTYRCALRSLVNQARLSRLTR
ncbi:MAG: hypothetical protein ACXWV7_09440 [Nitrospira sp.]